VRYIYGDKLNCRDNKNQHENLYNKFYIIKIYRAVVKRWFICFIKLHHNIYYWTMLWTVLYGS